MYRNVLRNSSTHNNCGNCCTSLQNVEGVLYQLRSGVMHKRHQFRCKPAPPVHHRSFWRWWRWWSTMMLKKKNIDVDDIDVQFLAQSALSGWVWMLWASSILCLSTVSLYKDSWSSCDKSKNKKRDFQLCFLFFGKYFSYNFLTFLCFYNPGNLIPGQFQAPSSQLIPNETTDPPKLVKPPKKDWENFKFNQWVN